MAAVYFRQLDTNYEKVDSYMNLMFSVPCVCQQDMYFNEIWLKVR